MNDVVVPLLHSSSGRKIATGACLNDTKNIFAKILKQRQRMKSTSAGCCCPQLHGWRTAPGRVHHSWQKQGPRATPVCFRARSHRAHRLGNSNNNLAKYRDALPNDRRLSAEFEGGLHGERGACNLRSGGDDGGVEGMMAPRWCDPGN
jgi:hypothetical protein